MYCSDLLMKPLRRELMLSDFRLSLGSSPSSGMLSGIFSSIIARRELRDFCLGIGVGSSSFAEPG